MVTSQEQVPAAVTERILLLQREALRSAPLFAMVAGGTAARTALASLREPALEPESSLAAAQRIVNQPSAKERQP